MDQQASRMYSYTLHGEISLVSQAPRKVSVCYDGAIIIGETIEIAGHHHEVVALFSDGSLCALSENGAMIYVTATQLPETFNLQDLIGYDAKIQENQIGCAAGTLVRTPSYEKAIEDLEIDDFVLTPGNKAVRIREIHTTRAIESFHFPELITPILIKQGAIGNNTPCQDLFVSQRQGLLMDDLAIEASALVNNLSITEHRCEATPLTYYAPVIAEDGAYVANGIAVEAIASTTALPRVAARRLLPRRIAIKLSRIAQSLQLVETIGATPCRRVEHV